LDFKDVELLGVVRVKSPGVVRWFVAMGVYWFGGRAMFVLVNRQQVIPEMPFLYVIERFVAEELSRIHSVGKDMLA
jgi:hypothetical protein